MIASRNCQAGDVVQPLGFSGNRHGGRRRWMGEVENQAQEARGCGCVASPNRRGTADLLVLTGWPAPTAELCFVWRMRDYTF